MIVISFVSNDLIQMTLEYKQHAPLFSLDFLFSCPIIIPWVQKHVFHKVLTPLRFYKAPVKPLLLNIGLYLLSIFTVVAHRTISSSGSWPCPFFVLPHFHRFQLNLKKEFLGIAWQLLSSPRSGVLTRETVQLNCSDGPDYDTSPTLWLALTMYIAVIQPNVRQSHLWSRNLSPLCHCEELRKLFHVIIRHRL